MHGQPRTSAFVLAANADLGAEMPQTDVNLLKIATAMFHPVNCIWVAARGIFFTNGAAFPPRRKRSAPRLFAPTIITACDPFAVAIDMVADEMIAPPTWDPARSREPAC